MLNFYVFCFFFFSSRRRHTRCSRDWSSDVCSSDLDHQIFERYHKFHLKNGYAKKQAITLKELTNLDIGDYVTHIDHGIGKFGGLKKIGRASCRERV